MGRYTLLEVLGRGSMGVVHAAVDRQLDRRVAIKLLLARTSGGPEPRRRARLLREARAIAATSHPNVVGVFDVGIDGDDVYVVMELIDGVDLRRWLTAGSRSIAEITDVMLQAARGLAAAHAANIVHRDFKPANVMVARDGRVRVLDFGLARAGQSSVEDVSDSEPSNPESASITRTGERLGTPAYMSPEQHLGLVADAASDQFAWAVVLHEALFGVRPFAGSSSADIAAAVLRDERVPWPRRSGVPTWWTALLDRALAPQPEQRFASMAAVIDAIHRGRGRRLVGIGGALAVGAVALAVALAPDPAPRDDGPCDHDAAPAVDAEVRAQVAGAFVDVDDGRAVVAALDERAAAIDEVHTETCAAFGRGAIDHDTLSARLACLADRRDRLAAFADVVVRARGSAIERARGAAMSLPSAATCVAATTTPTMLPGDPQLASDVLALRAAITEVTVYRQLGRGETALSLAAELELRADRIGWPPLVAEALLAHGEAASGEGALELAEQKLRDAVWLAEREGHDRVRVESYAELAWLRVVALEHYDEAGPLIAAGMAAAARVGDLGYRAILLNVRAAAEEGLGDRAAAIATMLEVVDTLRREPADAPTLANALHNLGNYQLLAGEQDAATASYTEAFALTLAALGEDHPETHGLRQALADARLMADDFAAAIPAYESVLEVRERLYGRDDPRLATTLNNLGRAEVEIGDAASGATHLERALVLKRSANAGAASLGNTTWMLGRAYGALGRIDEALAMLGEAALYRADLDATHPKAIELADAIEAVVEARPRDRPLSAAGRDVVAAAARRATLAGDPGRAARLGAAIDR